MNYCSAVNNSLAFSSPFLLTHIDCNLLHLSFLAYHFDSVFSQFCLFYAFQAVKLLINNQPINLHLPLEDVGSRSKVNC